MSTTPMATTTIATGQNVTTGIIIYPLVTIVVFLVVMSLGIARSQQFNKIQFHWQMLLTWIYFATDSMFCVTKQIFLITTKFICEEKVFVN
jgi:hypothetical protein